MTQVNTYDYNNKAVVPGQEQSRQSQSTDVEFKRKDRKHPGDITTDFSNQRVENG